MSEPLPDPELHARFAELKRQDALRAPSFADVLERAQAQAQEAVVAQRRASAITRRRVGWATGLATAAAIAALIVIPRTRSGDDAFAQAVQSFHSNPALGGWRSPTDALLDVPGSRLISTVPGVASGAQ